MNCTPVTARRQPLVKGADPEPPGTVVPLGQGIPSRDRCRELGGAGRGGLRTLNTQLERAKQRWEQTGAVKASCGRTGWGPGVTWMQRLRPPSLRALVLTPVGSPSLHQIHCSTTMRERTVKALPSPTAAPIPILQKSKLRHH